jgi:hypothetical protein
MGTEIGGKAQTIANADRPLVLPKETDAEDFADFGRK